jgi:putative membrane protein
MTSSTASRFTLRIGTFGFGIIAAAVCSIVLFFAIADIGFARIRSEVLAVGVGLAGIIGIHIGQLLFCALGWQQLFVGPAAEPRRPLGPLLALRWVRESIDHLLPVAQIGGEVIGARLLAGQAMSLPAAGASVIADLTIETLTQAVFTLIGLALLLALSDPGDVLRWAAIGFGVAVFLAGLAVFAQRWGGVRLFERMLLMIADRLGWNRLEGIAGLDRALSQVYTLRGRLLVAGFHHMVAWSLGTGEVLIAAWALGYDINVGEAFVIESLAQAVRSAAFFVPGAVGVQEGGFVVVAGLFGIPADVAISMSLTKRIRELVLGIPGLAAWQWHELQRRRFREKLEISPGTV